jgi:phosphatidylserine/phosphatidylglycerophosphate/cardiolipin synthase-like enzyme
MKRALLPLFILLAVAVTYLIANRGLPRMPDKLPPINAYFSPKGGCTDAIVREIDAAKSSILVQAYSFTSSAIAKALREAHKRGVQAAVILDKAQETDIYSEADLLLHEGIRTLIDAEHQIAHNKIMVIDGGVVITGSFNFTKQAEEGNAENLLIIRDPDIAKRYTDNWNVHAAHSREYEEKPKKGRDSPGDRKPSKPRRSNSRESEKGLEIAMKSLLD